MLYWAYQTPVELLDRIIASITQEESEVIQVATQGSWYMNPGCEGFEVEKNDKKMRRG